ncbi:serine/threonine-protein kinase BLUS1 [Gastrolobium bilobum]|uniref:serine/threonine-protein kinase BLUS1 n=1 Tax=Gastrolobium bilobum TaxID=150636 RepID=UPI002AB2595F|nr:serine/threonine-protein kinase BLUS1 [Gastrolobium bilobum]XP_061363198.1 serine/threonine-protein kinase BLUS1 [Gastrolobium bilobum]XP_061363199.1 serine/threonine-protein kinase BLUS1 [Gastrolobium bilobum]
MEHISEKRFPLNAEDYKLYEEVGEGVSASVYRALCIPLNEIVAIKVLDLEKCNNDLDGIRREVQTMSLIDHPNVLRAYCSFTAGHNLWVVMPYMAGGSCLHIMKSGYPEGFEEPVIATLLREVLKALVYLHAHGHIHRDVKAGNILLDSNGAVKLADFGVSACMFDAGDRQRSRNTFVGTPCWMAPEVMQQLHGYDFKADIWSFGITALELAHGHAPFSKYPPMKVLLMTLQNAPPGLDYERDKRFSKTFKELVATCLVKDPKKRPSSEKLLKHHFFKHARATEYLARTILDGLAPLGDRFRMLKAKEADLLVQNKALYEDKEQLSQKEYIRGISAWNFNLDDLKSQAALIQEDDMPNAEEPDMDKKPKDISDGFRVPTEGLSAVAANHSDGAPMLDKEDGFNNLQDLESSLASFPIKPLEALKDCFDICEDDVNDASPRDMDHDYGRIDNESSGPSSSLPQNATNQQKKFLSGSLLPDNFLSPKKVVTDGDRDFLQTKYSSERNHSGPLLYRQKRDTNNLPVVDDTSEGAVVQRRGRFKVTSADPSPMGPSNCTSGSVGGGTGSPPNQNIMAATILPSLQYILQQNSLQREEIIKLIKYAEQSCGKNTESAEAGTVDLVQVSPATMRERELHFQVNQLQQSIGSLVEELQRQKMKNVQLEKQLSCMVNKVDK